MIGDVMNRELFELYVESQLVPTLQTGDVIIPDNLSSHKSPKAADAMRAVGAWFLFLPPYSPDLNPYTGSGPGCSVFQSAMHAKQSELSLQRLHIRVPPKPGFM